MVMQAARYRIGRRLDIDRAVALTLQAEPA